MVTIGEESGARTDSNVILLGVSKACTSEAQSVLDFVELKGPSKFEYFLAPQGE
jgi:hypothetical protein